MTYAFYRTKPFAYLVHLLLPGLAHALYREYLFGLFIFLIMQLGAVLLAVSYLVTMPPAAQWLLLSLPFVFYLFSFLDLHKTISQKRERLSPKVFWPALALLFAAAYQLLAPTAPGNMILRNRPEFFRGDSNDYSPYVTRGDISTANRFAYAVNIPLMKKPILHALPERFDLVRYINERGERKVGLVVGLPGEEVECAAGILSASGVIASLPVLGNGELTGSWPLTEVDSYSILVAEVKLGVVSSVSQVSLGELVGRVGRLSR